ncbi:MAG: hypothetical protein ACTHJ2_05435 [Candidatus Nitrosocosmicus sp.]
MNIKDNTNNNSIKRSPRLKGEILENIILLLRLKEYSVSDLLFEIKRKLPLTSYSTLKKYLIYLADYELISYNGQRKVYLIECNGLDLLYWINK